MASGKPGAVQIVHHARNLKGAKAAVKLYDLVE
jgi:hypothetical protein